MRRSAAGLCLAFALAAASRAAAQEPAPTIAAAADLKFAVEDIAETYRRAGHGAVKLVFGSSGNFYLQIRQGAPFDIYMSADEAYVTKLADAGLTSGRGTLYGVGRIVLIAPHGSPLEVDARLDGLRAALAAGRIRRFAIANPEHAPYGRRAEEALRRAGLWDLVRPKLVLGENVAQATQFAVSGSAEGGIIAYSLALSPAVVPRGRFALLPADWHEPLRQRMVLLAQASPAARKFYAYLESAAARTVFKRYGFLLPDD